MKATVSSNAAHLLQVLTLWLALCQLVYGQHTTYYQQRATHFDTLPQTTEDIVFVGNSLSDGAEWHELLSNPHCKNRGISGDISQGVIDRLDGFIEGQPRKIFLLIGINDLARGLSPDQIVQNYQLILSGLKAHSPRTQLYVQSLLPVNPQFKKFAEHTAKASLIPLLNEQLKRLTEIHGGTYIDLYTHFLDGQQQLNRRFTNDGLHLNGMGYLHWKSAIYPYVFDLDPLCPSLIPMPQQLRWQAGRFLIPDTLAMFFDDSLSAYAKQIQSFLANSGAKFNQQSARKITLKIAPVAALHHADEAYQLKVDSASIELIANTNHGIFNGLQTLRQLCRDGVYVPACQIIDFPAFAWRGLMHDVGRNFQTLDYLKAQIDVMAQYKLNVFHLHLTEDVAWRPESKRFPQLTQPAFMTRNQGEYYTQTELLELIRYCQDRHVLLLPEIDMPGHSDAFKRATGADMQSPEGLKIVKELLHEFCQTFNVPYVHLGGDEVSITNADFLPEMVALVESYGKKVIGWNPGGNLPRTVIRQLWQGSVKPQVGIPTLDSRFLYLNHHDPLESVVTIFQAKICDVAHGDTDHLGGIVCVWPDRRVATQSDILRQNPVYPALLAASERLWLGGGKKLGKTLIGKPESPEFQQFEAFERRLLDHKKQYFSDKPFPYVRQTHIRWHITLPFNNKGALEACFEPEQTPEFTQLKTPTQVAAGGTIYLRHWWHPMSESFLPNPTENSTVYAFAQVWSDYPQTAGLWVSFNNLSRSTATDSPAIGTWDDRKSQLWLNGELVKPYAFSRTGQKGHAEIPLTDESYEYRLPLLVTLKKGWNQVLVKAPVGRFKSEWQNPVKWMFTVAFVDPQGHNPDALPLKYWSGEAPNPAPALRIDEVFRSGMVIQQQKKLRIQGTTSPGRTLSIKVSQGNRLIFKQNAVASSTGRWQVLLPRQRASTIPQSWLIADGTDSLTLNDILVGDVWLCVGQSNMAFMLKNDTFAAQTLRGLRNPALRLLNKKPNLSTFNVTYKPTELSHLNPEKFYLERSWETADSLSARDFSAVGFYFGQSVQQATGVPIGLINLAVGGSPCEAWIPQLAVADDDSLSSLYQGNWLKNSDLEPWCIERGHDNLNALLAAQALVPQDFGGPNHPFKPAFLYEAGIRPLTSLPIKGIIWYQGESNALSLARTQQHERLFPKLVQFWRTKWGYEFPFFYCQLSSISTEKGYRSTYWPEFRDSQRRMATRIPNVGMVVTSDYGHPTDVHPTNKKVVGERLARSALKQTYGHNRLTMHPNLKHITASTNHWILRFDLPLGTTSGQAVRGFELCNSEGNCIAAEGIIKGSTVTIKKPKNFISKQIRYGWQPYSNANLISTDGMPVSTFRQKL